MNRFSFAIIMAAMAISCGSAAAIPESAPQNERQLAGDNPLLDNWEKEEGLASMLNDMIASSKTTSPTLNPTEEPTNKPTKKPTNEPTNKPTNRPTEHPTVSPTLSPSEQPTQDPTLRPTENPSESLQPSTQPSTQPTAHPSDAPTTSFSPSAAPSSKPTIEPTDAPSMSQEPTASPTLQPSPTPTVKPSTSPSKMASATPSSSVSPTEQPTKSTSPSAAPSYKAMESSIIIDQSRTRSATPLLIVGAACFVVMASTGAFLCKRGAQLKKNRKGNAPSIIELSSPSKHGGGIESPYSVRDGLGPGQDTFSVNYSESDSHVTEDRTVDYNYATEENHGELIDIDLEAGRVGIDAVPNSVSIITRSQLQVTTDDDNMLQVVSTKDENEIAEIHSPANYSLGDLRLRMPKSIYVPKIFQRTREGEENSSNERQIVTWNQIREEDGSPASSGYAPASVPSPTRLSPFFVKGLSSVLSPYAGKRGSVVNNGDGMEGVVASATMETSRSKNYVRKGKNKGATQSPIKEIVVKRDAPSPGDDVFAGLEETVYDESALSQHKEDMSSQLSQSSKTLGSKSSDESSIEWGIDVSKVQPSKKLFEDNMAELQNLMVSIKSIGSGEVPNTEDVISPRGAVPMTYTYDSWESHKSGHGMHDQQSANEGSPKSDESTYLGDIDIAPVDSKSQQDNNSTRSSLSSLPSFNPHLQAIPPNSTPNESGITYQTELLNASKMLGEGTFSFRNIFNDPKNDLYECHAPSGPLGIVVDTTPLGPRVRSLNPLSPIFANVSPGDVIVGVDEADTVGMEAGVFWQIVSRKANQQKRILTILRI